jgi:hypothetical protein
VAWVAVAWVAVVVVHRAARAWAERRLQGTTTTHTGAVERRSIAVGTTRVLRLLQSTPTALGMGMAARSAQRRQVPRTGVGNGPSRATPLTATLAEDHRREGTGVGVAAVPHRHHAGVGGVLVAELQRTVVHRRAEGGEVARLLKEGGSHRSTNKLARQASGHPQRTKGHTHRSSSRLGGTIEFSTSSKSLFSCFFFVFFFCRSITPPDLNIFQLAIQYKEP